MKDKTARLVIALVLLAVSLALLIASSWPVPRVEQSVPLPTIEAPLPGSLLPGMEGRL